MLGKSSNIFSQMVGIDGDLPWRKETNHPKNKSKLGFEQHSMLDVTRSHNWARVMAHMAINPRHDVIG